jgi:hypothetical protein
VTRGLEIQTFGGDTVRGDIAVFTLHKSASMFLHRQCELLCRLSNLPYHSPNIPGSGLDARRVLTDKELWAARTGCFGPLRFFVEIPRFEEYQILLHVRDPRDVLVSMFYSYCYIHNGEVQADTGYRARAAREGIDAFVLAKASADSSKYPGDYGTGGHVEDLIGNVPTRYRNYVEHFLGRPNVCLVKYEEMVTDYRAWLTRFIAPFPIANKAAVIEEQAALAPTFFPKRADDARNHVRHVTPGDHKTKLLPATIRRLDAIFADVLDALHYDRSAS